MAQTLETLESELKLMEQELQKLKDDQGLSKRIRRSRRNLNGNT